MANTPVLDKQPSPMNQAKGPGHMNIWKYPFCGCCDNCCLCLCTCCFPCCTMARNAAYFGEDGCLVGTLYCIGCYGFGPVMRHRIRTEKNIVGSIYGDVCYTMCCPCCSLIQENRELYGLRGCHYGQEVPLREEMEH